LALEDRITTLEHENQVLRMTVQESLAVLQEILESEAPSPLTDRWQRRAWVLALMNVALAVTLFVNVRYLTLENLPPTLTPRMVLWLRGLWMVLAFVWLLLQLYPLSLLFESQEMPPRRLAWRSAIRLLTSSPAMVFSVTGFVLLITLLSVLWPAGWIWLMGAVMVGIAYVGVKSARQ
jgi:hypothetical protein